MSATRNMTAEKIEELRALHQKTGGGEWRYSYAHVTAFGPNGEEQHVCNFSRVQNRGQIDAAFIAHAHAAFPELLALAEEALRRRAAAEPEAKPNPPRHKYSFCPACSEDVKGLDGCANCETWWGSGPSPYTKAEPEAKDEYTCPECRAVGPSSKPGDPFIHDPGCSR